METPPASAALEKLGIPHRMFRHENPVTTFEQAAAERGQRVLQIVRSILFRLSEDKFVMVLIAGAAQVSWKILRKHLGSSRMTMATEDEVLAVTGYPIGAVSPFGLSNPLRVLVDESVLREDEISLGSGIRDGKYYVLSAVEGRFESTIKYRNLSFDCAADARGFAQDEKHHDGESHDQFQTTRAGFFGNRMGDLHREV